MLGQRAEQLHEVGIDHDQDDHDPRSNRSNELKRRKAPPDKVRSVK